VRRNPQKTFGKGKVKFLLQRRGRKKRITTSRQRFFIINAERVEVGAGGNLAAGSRGRGEKKRFAFGGVGTFGKRGKRLCGLKEKNC